MSPGLALGGLALGGVALLAWPGLRRRPAWPVHLLRGESLATDLLLGAVVYTIWIARFAGLLLVRDQAGLAIGTIGLIVTVALTNRRQRSAAAPLLEDAVWLCGLCLAGCAGGSSAGALAAGAATGTLATALLLGLLVALWGQGHAFTITARPDFQVFAPNPDNRYALGRIRVCAGRHVVAIVPDNRNRFTHVSVYDPHFRCVHLSLWPDLRDAMAARGHLRVHVGPEADAPGADVSVVVPPGRYYLTVRNYLSERPDEVQLPRATAWDGLGAPPWTALEGS